MFFGCTQPSSPHPHLQLGCNANANLEGIQEGAYGDTMCFLWSCPTEDQNISLHLLPLDYYIKYILVRSVT